jgi:methyl-accepting chemotaxis protein
LIIEGITREVQERKLTEATTEQELQALLQIVDAVAAGDLTQRCDEKDTTLGRIGRSLNGMMTRFAKILAEVRDAAHSVSTAATEILTEANQITNGAQHSGNQVQNTMSSVQQMTTSMSVVSQHADESEKRARSVLEHARVCDIAMDSAHQAISNINAAVLETTSKMHLLEERSEEIFAIVELIEKIAKQSRLLSLNAAIQASQAGEAGRGFVVVAEELRHLADSSTQATKDVTESLNGLVNGTHPVVEALAHAKQEATGGRKLSEQARASLHEISTLILSLTNASAQIAKASREQTQTTETVATAMKSIAKITIQSTASSIETTKTVETLVALAERLNHAIARFKV